MTSKIYDFCIVGGGTVGIYMAGLLADTGRKVVVVEAGKTQGDRRRSVYNCEAPVTDHVGVRKGWTTGYGGTSQLWGGQLWPWQDWEFKLDSPPGLKAWPLPYAEVQPFYGKVLERLGLPRAHSEIHSGRLEDIDATRLQHRELSTKFSTWMSSRRRNFARNPSLKRPMRAVDVVAGESVSRIVELSPQLVEVHCKNKSESASVYRAKVVVLAAGTLGNVRILAGSDIAASLPRLGSGFTDHVSRRFAELRVTDWRRLRAFAAHRRSNGVHCSPRIVPSLQFIREQNILPIYAHIEFELKEGGFPLRARDLMRARQLGGGFPKLFSLFVAGLRDLPELVEATTSGIRNHQRPILRSSTAYLRVDVQQPARSQNRLIWRRASTGELETELHWSVGVEENHSANVFGQEVAEALNSSDMGATVSGFFPNGDFVDIFHMMGGTPMGCTVEEGVVDANQKVFGTSNVYVSGASTFPSGGMANPTFTALALAHRLATYLGK